jgi:hypothetical protein
MNQNLKETRNEFFKVPGGCLAIIAAIHVLPKSPQQGSFRLLLTVAYFGAILALLWSMTKPREEYLRKLYAWRFEDCGPALEKSWQLYLHSLANSVNIAVYIAMTFIASTALATLQQWPTFQALDAFAQLYNLAWYLSLIALPAFAFFGDFLLSETFQRYRLLREQLVTSGFTPKDVRNLDKEAAAPPRKPVEVVKEYEFYAGGTEWAWEDFYKNCIVFGQSGTGKTVCVLNALLDGLLASTKRCSEKPSGLILDPKGDFYDKIQVVCKKHGREKDLLILDPQQPQRSLRWNPLDSDDDELELAARFAAVLETLGMKSEQDSFWIDSAKKFIRHSIALVRLTNPPDEPPTFAQIGQLASTLAAISERADLVADDDPRGELCLGFFANEWVDLADQTRSSIQAYITNMIDPFLMDPYATLFSGRSTVCVADMLSSGKILYVYMPIADKEAMSRMVSTFIKLEYYREVLKRPNKKRASFFLCDEFQAFFTAGQGKGDADFFERSRQSNHANIIATQNLPSLTKQVKQQDPVMNLLGNCAVKMFLRNTDAETNRYASELFGEQIVLMQNSNSGGGGRGSGFAGMRSITSSQGANAQYDAKVRKEVFTELAVPFRKGGMDYCETIVHLASRGQVSKEKLRWKVHPLTA